MKKPLLFLVMTLLPMLASAYDAKINGIYYNLSGNEATVTRSTSYNLYSGAVVIPSSVTYNGTTYSVTSIGNSAFNGCTGLTSVTIPSSVTSIGSGAFYDCRSLTSITIPGSVTSIGNNAFNGCTGLTSVTIPNSVTSIGESAFGLNWNLTSIEVETGNPKYDSRNNCNAIIETATNNLIRGCKNTTIPNNVTSIGNSAFSGCSGLTSVTIPGSVTSIGSYAFAYCSSLTSVTIGSGVISIENDAFTNFSPKKVIWLPNTPPSGYQGVKGTMNYVANDNYTGLSNITVYPFLSSTFEVEGIKYVPVSPSERTCAAIDCAYNKSAENINIGESVTNKGISLTVKQIGAYLCYGNPFIKNVNLGFQGDIDSYAFSDCNNLNLAVICNQGSIGDFAFSSCKLLQTAELGQGITSIGSYAFQKCSILQSIVIPDAVTSMGRNTFENCSAMTYAKIGNNLKSIPPYAFSSCSSLQDVQIGNGVTSIGKYALSGCSSLPTIQIPQNVTTIGDYVFANCTNLKTVLMDDGEGELSLGSNVSSPLFANCPLDSVYIGRNITYPTASYPTVSESGYSPFYNNKSLRSVTIADKETEITAREFNGCSALQAVELGEGILSVGNSAFKDCSKLQSIVIPDSVVSIGNNAFENCSAMTYAKIGNNLKSIPSYAFSSCSSLQDVQIGNGVTSIGTYALSGCSSLPTIQIPQNVTSIENNVFNGCKSLKIILMDDGEGELSLGSNDSSPLFVNCPLDSVYIGRNITYPTASSKGYSPFFRNTSLRSVAITDRETEISTNEFYGCTNLKNVRIGDGVTSFGDWAFSGCSSLDYFSFGSSVKTIGKEAFSDCTAMTRLISKAETPPTCDSQALDDINKWECNLYVPDGSLAAYQTTDQWKEFFFLQVDPDGISENKSEELRMKNEGDWYDLSGRKINSLPSGRSGGGHINITRHSDGTSRKVLVK